jgi:hypothetical protein
MRWSTHACPDPGAPGASGGFLRARAGVRAGRGRRTPPAVYRIDITLGLRVPPEDEFTGLDLTQHAESAYSMGGTGRLGG